MILLTEPSVYSVGVKTAKMKSSTDLLSYKHTCIIRFILSHQSSALLERNLLGLWVLLLFYRPQPCLGMCSELRALTFA